MMENSAEEQSTSRMGPGAEHDHDDDGIGIGIGIASQPFGETSPTDARDGPTSPAPPSRKLNRRQSDGIQPQSLVASITRKAPPTTSSSTSTATAVTAASSVASASTTQPGISSDRETTMITAPSKTSSLLLHVAEEQQKEQQQEPQSVAASMTPPDANTHVNANADAASSSALSSPMPSSSQKSTTSAASNVSNSINYSYNFNSTSPTARESVRSVVRLLAPATLVSPLSSSLSFRHINMAGTISDHYYHDDSRDDDENVDLPIMPKLQHRTYEQTRASYTSYDEYEDFGPVMSSAAAVAASSDTRSAVGSRQSATSITPSDAAPVFRYSSSSPPPPAPPASSNNYRRNVHMTRHQQMITAKTKMLQPGKGSSDSSDQKSEATAVGAATATVTASSPSLSKQKRQTQTVKISKRTPTTNTMAGGLGSHNTSEPSPAAAAASSTTSTSKNGSTDNNNGNSLAAKRRLVRVGGGNNDDAGAVRPGAYSVKNAPANDDDDDGMVSLSSTISGSFRQESTTVPSPKKSAPAAAATAAASAPAAAGRVRRSEQNEKVRPVAVGRMKPGDSESIDDSTKSSAYAHDNAPMTSLSDASIQTPYTKTRTTRAAAAPASTTVISPRPPPTRTRRNDADVKVRPVPVGTARDNNGAAAVGAYAVDAAPPTSLSDASIQTPYTVDGGGGGRSSSKSSRPTTATTISHRRPTTTTTTTANTATTKSGKTRLADVGNRAANRPGAYSVQVSSSPTGNETTDASIKSKYANSSANRHSAAVGSGGSSGSASNRATPVPQSAQAPPSSSSSSSTKPSTRDPSSFVVETHGPKLETYEVDMVRTSRIAHTDAAAATAAVEAETNPAETAMDRHASAPSIVTSDRSEHVSEREEIIQIIVEERLQKQNEKERQQQLRQQQQRPQTAGADAGNGKAVNFRESSDRNKNNNNNHRRGADDDNDRISNKVRTEALSHRDRRDIVGQDDDDEEYDLEDDDDVVVGATAVPGRNGIPTSSQQVNSDGNYDSYNDLEASYNNHNNNSGAVMTMEEAPDGQGTVAAASTISAPVNTSALQAVLAPTRNDIQVETVDHDKDGDDEGRGTKVSKKCWLVIIVITLLVAGGGAVGLALALTSSGGGDGDGNGNGNNPTDTDSTQFPTTAPSTPLPTTRTPTMPPTTTERFFEFVDALSASTDDNNNNNGTSIADRDVLLHDGTSQNLAVKWLANVDLFFSTTSDLQNDIPSVLLQQRYIIVLLYFAGQVTNPDTALSVYNILSTTKNICEWNDGMTTNQGVGIFCENGDVIEINFGTFVIFIVVFFQPFSV